MPSKQAFHALKPCSPEAPRAKINLARNLVETLATLSRPTLAELIPLSDLPFSSSVALSPPSASRSKLGLLWQTLSATTSLRACSPRLLRAFHSSPQNHLNPQPLRVSISSRAQFSLRTPGCIEARRIHLTLHHQHALPPDPVNRHSSLHSPYPPQFTSSRHDVVLIGLRASHG